MLHRPADVAMQDQPERLSGRTAVREVQRGDAIGPELGRRHRREQVFLVRECLYGALCDTPAWWPTSRSVTALGPPSSSKVVATSTSRSRVDVIATIPLAHLPVNLIPPPPPPVDAVNLSDLRLTLST